MSGRGIILAAGAWTIIAVLGWCLAAVLTAVWWPA